MAATAIRRWLQYDTLVFSGGGTKGFAEVGAIQALESHYGLLGPLSWRARIHTFIGTSFGAIVAAMAALGLSGGAMEQWMSSITLRTFFMPDWFRLLSHGDGFDDGSRGKAFMRRIIVEGAGLPGDITLQQLYEATNRDLVTAVTNLEHNRMEALSRYTEPHIQVVDAVYASACLPVLYRPQPLHLAARVSAAPVPGIDGGLHANTPIQLAPPGKALAFVLLSDDGWHDAVAATRLARRSRGRLVYGTAASPGSASDSSSGGGGGGGDGGGETEDARTHTSHSFLASMMTATSASDPGPDPGPDVDLGVGVGVGVETDADADASRGVAPAPGPGVDVFEVAPVPEPPAPPPRPAHRRITGVEPRRQEEQQQRGKPNVLAMLAGAASHLLQSSIEDQLLQLDATFHEHMVLLETTAVSTMDLFRATHGMSSLMQPLLRRGFECTSAFLEGQPVARAGPWLTSRRLAMHRFQLVPVLQQLLRLVLHFAFLRTVRQLRDTRWEGLRQQQ